MKHVITLFYLALSTCMLPPAFADHPGRCDFPDPGYKIEEHSFTGVSLKEYTEALDLVQNVYAPIFQAQGCKLNIVRSWADGTINAQAWRVSNTCYVEMFGGLARYPTMTKGALIEVALHEIGHHLGGFPYYTGESMSVEGQADYYATKVGMKKVKVPSADPSLALAVTLAELGGEAVPWRPGPRLPYVSQTMEEHPPAQCRLKTFDAGRLNRTRPRCWFKP
jgi:hypothetical protein